MNRRQFLSAAATTAASSAFLAAATTQPATKLNLGLIGCGGYGLTNATAALKSNHAQITALCDVDSTHLAQAAARIEKLQGARPQTFKLYEDLLKFPGLDAVIIATPPHWHALQLIAAVEKGLDVYCEKPLAYDIREGRAMVDAARKSGRVVQIGFQRRQAGGFVGARNHIQAGNAGKILQAEAQIHYKAGTLDTTPQPPPESLDWDLWCGPGPKIPYCPQVAHRNWRLEKTSGHGHLVDWGIHLIDAARFILNESTPRTVHATGGLYHLDGKITTPDILHVHFEFKTCPLTWHHRIYGAQEFIPEVANGIFFYGESETLFVFDDRFIIIPRGKPRDPIVHTNKTDAGLLHMTDFLTAVRTRQQPACRIEDAHLSTTAVKLAMISYDTASRITWDPDFEQIPKNPEAAKLLKRDYRSPWQHPYRS